MPLSILLAQSGEMRLPGLAIRRKSLLSRQNSLVLPNTAPQVPTEIVDSVIECYVIALSPLLAIPTIESQTAVFAKYISPCTLVSKDFHFLVLRSFFRSLSMSTSDDFSGLLDFLGQIDSQYHKNGLTGGYSWVRSLSAPAFLIPSNVQELQKLPRLHVLHIDFSHSGLLLQRSCLGQLFKSVGTHGIVLKLTSLMLTNLPCIDEPLLKMVALKLPGLIDLHLSSADSLDLDCCPNCYEDSLGRILHSPISEVYIDAESLATAIGRALVPLKNLTRLFLGIYLSPSGMLDMHMAHGTQDSLSTNTVETVYNCARCARFTKATKERELLASLIIGRHLVSLADIGWSSCFSTCSFCSKSNHEGNVLEASIQHESEVGTVASEALITRTKCDCRDHLLKTMLAIHRMCGRIKVTRVL